MSQEFKELIGPEALKETVNLFVDTVSNGEAKLGQRLFAGKTILERCYPTLKAVDVNANHVHHFNYLSPQSSSQAVLKQSRGEALTETEQKILDITELAKVKLIDETDLNELGLLNQDLNFNEIEPSTPEINLHSDEKIRKYQTWQTDQQDEC